LKLFQFLRERDYVTSVVYPLTSAQNLLEIVAGNPSVGCVKRKRGSKIKRWWTCRRLYRI